ncbi:MAG: FecR domain-containing protein [Candidatus Hydrogenedentes bacterium]|nr:FecR domain-containing protein [Candidatus Hydrogenedentota bacterium]
MASCTQIEGLLQAYIDGELGQSDRIILDRHVNECPVCAALFTRHQRASAIMFEVFAEDRLFRDLSPAVLENLPEMQMPKQDMEGINWRVKHPANWSSPITRFVPVGVLAVLVVLFFIIREHWPAPLPSESVIGMITHVGGSPTKLSGAAARSEECALEGFVNRGDRYITGKESTLILSMLGPTQLKLSENSHLKVETDRRLSLEEGELWLDIGGEANPFKVLTPNGEVTVFGTSFDVRVTKNETTVTVKRGNVTAENALNVRSLVAGDQVVLPATGEVPPVHAVDVVAVTKWADLLSPEERATTAFDYFLKRFGSQTELTGRAVFLFNTQRDDGAPMAVKSIELSWNPDSNSAHHCGYTVYVFDDASRVLFRERIDASVFNDHSLRSIEIPVPGKPIKGVKQLSVRLVPDYRSGEIQTSFDKVTASVS